jgi:Fur family ferric uptake transcriptional regulator
MMIIAAIKEGRGHLSADEIHARVREKYPYVDISTVYRTLELLKGLGLVTETDMGRGRLVYEFRGTERPHHHLICQGCGRTFELDHRFLEPLEETLLEEYGFEAHIHHFAVFGRCADCRARETEAVEGEMEVENGVRGD